ncbi:MAG: hypothetical protein ACHQE6_00120 [Solirubrobacterales bacterium]
MRMRGPQAISSTAHDTGYVWVRNGLSHPELATREGRALFEALRPVMTLSGVLADRPSSPTCSPATGPSTLCCGARSRRPG